MSVSLSTGQTKCLLPDPAARECIPMVPSPASTPHKVERRHCKELRALEVVPVQILDRAMVGHLASSVALLAVRHPPSGFAAGEVGRNPSPGAATRTKLRESLAIGAVHRLAIHVLDFLVATALAPVVVVRALRGPGRDIGRTLAFLLDAWCWITPLVAAGHPA